MTITPALPLFGHTNAQSSFLAARNSERLHHAWIIQGLSGIGKSRFALRLAALQLGANPVPEDAAGAPASDPIMQKILSNGHPDLKTVQRQLNEKGNLRQDIAVDQIRELNAFFSLKPALGGWRVGIIDSLDEMNTSSLNALLKTLEEPPANSLLFLISHATAPILPTIRSRCQTLHLHPLSREDTQAVLELIGSDTTADLASLVRGRPGRAEELAGGKVMVASSAAQSLVKNLPSTNEAQLAQAILYAGEDEQTFSAFAETILDWVSDRAAREPVWSEVWFEGQKIVSAQKSLHIPPDQAAAKLVARLQSAFANR